MSGQRLIYSNSGDTPGSVAGGPRRKTASTGPEQTPLWLGATSREVGMWAVIAALVAACILVAAL